MTTKHKVVYLSVTTWRGGYCNVGIHWYGRIRCGGKEVDLQCVLTVEQAKQLNERQDWDGWNPGDQAACFWSLEDLYAAAHRDWKIKFPDAGLLVDSDHIACGPFRVLDGPEELWKFAPGKRALYPNIPGLSNVSH